MDSEFWIKAWNEGRTNFHQEEYNNELTQYFPRLNPKNGQKVLVPLCGKSKDLLWLHELNLQVHGIELHEQAVKSFFTENRLSPLHLKMTREQDFINYTYTNANANTHGNIVISCGDFFKLEEVETYDFIYDRAALVALPATMRKNYAQRIKQSLKKGGKCLLIVYEYDQSKLDGPPFSVDGNEVNELYGDQLTINLMESNLPDKEGSKFSILEVFTQKIYILEKNR